MDNGFESPAMKGVVRQRRARGIDERLVDEALSVWIQWLMLYVLPKATTTTLAGRALAVFETDRPLFSTQHSPVSNPTLEAVLRDERMHLSWPKSLHAMVAAMPRPHRYALLGRAMGFNQMEIGAAIGVCQQRVSVVVREARLMLHISIAAFRHSRSRIETAQDRT